MAVVDLIIRRMSLGTGRPIVLRDENTIRHCRVLLNHPMASPTDVRLISLVELIAHKSACFFLLTKYNQFVTLRISPDS